MNTFFHSWESIMQVILTILITYPALIIFLRIAGKRSLAKLNMFDFIITVALGSVFASTVISKGVSIIDGLVATAILLSAQFLVSRLSLAETVVEDLIKSEPTILFRKGHFLEDEMKAVRVTRAEILASIRQAGIACVDKVHAIVLETNGELSVLSEDHNVTSSSMINIQNYRET